MNNLDATYKDQLDALQEELMKLEAYAQYLDTEEDEFYETLHETMNPKISELYHQVANEKPLQLLAFEKELLRPELEGMFLPRMLGYTVMRGVIDTATYKYLFSQEHFKEVLEVICESPNFELLSNRVGQTIQLGFGLSSDIWVTNLINQFANKRIKNYLLAQKNSRYSELTARKALYVRYLRQFSNDNYFTITFPESRSEFSVFYPNVRDFVEQRVRLGVDDPSMTKKLVDFVSDKKYFASNEQFVIMVITANFVKLPAPEKQKITTLFNDLRKEFDDFDERYLKLLIEFYNIGLPLNETSDATMASIVKKVGEKDDLVDYYELANIIHEKGFANEDVIEQVRVFYNLHAGRSLENKAVRNIILSYAKKFSDHLTVEEYQGYFELMDIFTKYIEIFDNEKFKQRIKDYSMVYVRKLLKHYTDKRGKDYQDIKRFITRTFQDLKFMKKKELVELFKTKRPRKAPEKA